MASCVSPSHNCADMLSYPELGSALLCKYDLAKKQRIGGMHEGTHTHRKICTKTYHTI